MGLATQLPHLQRILEERGGPVLPLLRAVEAANESRHYMDVSALSKRWTLLLPARPEVLTHLAPGMKLPSLPSRPLLKVFGDGVGIHIALSSAGNAPASVAVEGALLAHRPKWLEVITAMESFGNGKISSHMRFLDLPRSSIDVLYPARAASDDATFSASIDQIAWRLGVAPAQRDLVKANPMSAKGAAIVVTTTCTQEGPEPEMWFMSGNTDWDEAVRLCRVVAGEEGARNGAARLGTLAATLQLDTTSGVQLQVRPDGLDISVLVTLA